MPTGIIVVLGVVPAIFRLSADCYSRLPTRYSTSCFPQPRLGALLPTQQLHHDSDQSHTHHFRNPYIPTEMQTIKDHPEVYVPPKRILAKAILTRLPLEVRYNIYSYLWSTDTAAEVDYMAFIHPGPEHLRKKASPFVPNFVDRDIFGPEFAGETVKWLYESEQLGIMTKSLQWRDVPEFFRTDVFEVGIAPRDVQIRRLQLCVELDIPGISEYNALNRGLYDSLEPLFNAQVKRNAHVEIRIAQKVVRRRRRGRDPDQGVRFSPTSFFLRRRIAEAVLRLADMGFSIDITYGLLVQRQDGSYHRTTPIPLHPTLLDDNATLEQWGRLVTDALQSESGSSNAHLRLG